MRRQWADFWRVWRLVNRGAGMWICDHNVPDACYNLMPFDWVALARSKDDQYLLPRFLRDQLTRNLRDRQRRETRKIGLWTGWRWN